MGIIKAKTQKAKQKKQKPNRDAPSPMVMPNNPFPMREKPRTNENKQRSRPNQQKQNPKTSHLQWQQRPFHADANAVSLKMLMQWRESRKVVSMVIRSALTCPRKGKQRSQSRHPCGSPTSLPQSPSAGEWRSPARRGGHSRR